MGGWKLDLKRQWRGRRVIHMVTPWFCFLELNTDSDVAPAVSQFHRSLWAMAWVLELLKADALQLEKTGRKPQEAAAAAQQTERWQMCVRDHEVKTESATSVSLLSLTRSVKSLEGQRACAHVCIDSCLCSLYIWSLTKWLTCFSAAYKSHYCNTQGYW